MLRKPAVAGQFYSASPTTLRNEVGRYINENPNKKKVIGVVSPHAGFIYSGSTAGAVFSEISIPETVLLLGPNHTGIGKQISIMSSGSWEMPQGNVDIDEKLASLIKHNTDLVKESTEAHQNEHSLEVQLPFMQYFKNKFKIVPISIMFCNRNTCLNLGKAISQALKEYNKWHGLLSGIFSDKQDVS